MNQEELCKCCTCGFEWKKELHGGHNCAENMIKTINEFKRLLEEIKDWDINNKMKQGQFLLSHKIRTKIQKITEI